MEHIKEQLPQILGTLTGQPQANTRSHPAFDDFVLVGNETEEERLQLSTMLLEAKQFCTEMTQGGNPRWLSLLGHSGVGKTMISKAIGVWLGFDRLKSIWNLWGRKTDSDIFSYIQEKPPFIKWSKLVDEMRQGGYFSFQRACDDYCKIVDDIGAESTGQDGLPTPFVISNLSKLCDGRIGKWTIFTSNFTRSQLAETFDTRIASRMMRDGNVIVECVARDYNLRIESNKRVACPRSVNEAQRDQCFIT